MQQKSIAKNVIFSVSAQAVSFVVSLIVGLIVPKFIDEYQYAYWQMYILYVGYVGVLHFGIIDGLVLRYAQFDYDQLNKPIIRSQLYLLLFIDTVIAFIVAFIGVVFASGTTKTVIVFVSIGIITKNLFTYSSYLLQITNRIKKYAGIVVVQRAIYGALAVLLLLFHVNSFVWFCIADLVCDCCAIVYGFVNSKDLYIGKPVERSLAIKEIITTASAGIFVLVANWTSNLIIGGGKMIVQWRWDELVFGKMSFAFSISNLFLTFVSAISIVLFPSIKRMQEDQLPTLYKKIRSAVSPILFLALLLYFPGSWVLSKWIPKYNDSLVYLGILLPIIVYTTKVNLLTNNYLKAYRKERLMLYINLVSVAIGFALYFFSAYVANNITMLMISIVCILMARSIISEIVVSKFIKTNFYREFLIEGIMTGVFIVCANYSNRLFGFSIYIVVLAVYLFFYRSDILSIISKIHFGGNRK